MNAKETLKEIEKERRKVVKVLRDSERRSQELLWAMEEDATYGQEHMDAAEALKIGQTLKCAVQMMK